MRGSAVRRIGLPRQGVVLYTTGSQMNPPGVGTRRRGLMRHHRPPGIFPLAKPDVQRREARSVPTQAQHVRAFSSGRVRENLEAEIALKP